MSAETADSADSRLLPDGMSIRILCVTFCFAVNVVFKVEIARNAQ